MDLTNFPMHAWPQHRYPRLRGARIDADGEVTVHLCRGLPCCGLDLEVQHPPTMTALELYQIAGLFDEFTEKVKALPIFNTCEVRHETRD